MSEFEPTNGGAAWLECTVCGKHEESERLTKLSVCCKKPLFARYDLSRIRERFRPESLKGRRSDIWRYEEVLPVRGRRFLRSLGEGFTPLVPAPDLASKLGVGRLWIKDEGLNPTGSFKARGLAMAVARAAELGATSLTIPSAGNAGCAASAYGALFGLPVHVVVPADTPAPIVAAIRALGADLELVDGFITDCGKIVQRGAKEHGWFDLSTLKEPYRVEGKKTMGYELFEQLGQRLPDVIVYPTGGGTGLIGMWKAFQEMEEMGWIGPERPRMVTVQATGCSPIVQAHEKGRETAEVWENAVTYASGLRVPSAVADYLMLRVLKESHGHGVSVSDQQMAEHVRILGSATGIFACPEGGACVAAVGILRKRRDVGADEEVVVFNTGSGFNYVGMEPVL